MGFDPTADSLHIGNLCQSCCSSIGNGAHPHCPVGGATGMVGDPSGKTAERQFLDLDVLQHNLRQRKQLEKLDSKATTPRAWSTTTTGSKMWVLDFIRDVGKYITVNYMMSKDSVKNRLKADELTSSPTNWCRIRFYHLEEHRVKSKWEGDLGNIVTGTELIRRKGSGQAFAITAPLITKADGSKFGKVKEAMGWPKSAHPPTNSTSIG